MGLSNRTTDDGIFGRKDIYLKGQERLAPHQLRDTKRKKQLREDTALLIQEKIKREQRREVASERLRNVAIVLAFGLLILAAGLTSEQVAPESAEAFRDYFNAPTAWRSVGPSEDSSSLGVWDCNGTFTSFPVDPSQCVFLSR